MTHLSGQAASPLSQNREKMALACFCDLPGSRRRWGYCLCDRQGKKGHPHAEIWLRCQLQHPVTQAITPPPQCRHGFTCHCFVLVRFYSDHLSLCPCVTKLVISLLMASLAWWACSLLGWFTWLPCWVCQASGGWPWALDREQSQNLSAIFSSLLSSF